MKIPKKYFEDKVALSLSSVSLLCVVMTVITVLLRLNLSSGSNFIIGYRANLGIEAFKSGGPLDIINLLIFALAIFVLQTILTWRVYPIKRNIAIGILSAGLLLLLVCLIVSNALLALH